MKIVYGIGDYQAARIRHAQILSHRVNDEIFSIGSFPPCRWNRSALLYRQNLFQFLLKDIVEINPDIIISDEESFSKKIAKQLSIPLIELSYRANADIVQNPFSLEGVQYRFKDRSSDGTLDACCLIRREGRLEKIKPILDSLSIDIKYHDKINDNFWQDENRANIIFIEGDGESLSLGLTGKHAVIIIPMVDDQEEIYFSKLAKKIGVRSAGQIELSPSFCAEKIAQSIYSIEPIEYIMPVQPSLNEALDKRIQYVCSK